MPKFKSKRALRKRVRLTGSGRLRRHRVQESHPDEEAPQAGSGTCAKRRWWRGPTRHA